ncbi:hypothetical protein KI387_007380, partial [Taxus chinensis]
MTQISSAPSTGFTTQTMMNGSTSFIGANPAPVANQGGREFEQCASFCTPTEGTEADAWRAFVFLWFNSISCSGACTSFPAAVSLYVGDLDADVTEKELAECFGRIGHLTSNLHESISHATLQDTFIKFGNILSCKVVMQDGKSKGYGYVHFESEEAATAAIENVNGTVIEGKQVYVENFIKKQERTGSSADQKFTNLYIKNLEKDVTEELLSEKFSTFGKIASIVVMKDENGISKGFGFVNFDNPDDAKNAVESMNGSQLGSKAIYVARAQKKAERAQMLKRQRDEKAQENILKYQGSNLYIKNIDDTVDEEELRKVFGQHGTIISAKIMLDEKGLHKGYGFVCFTKPEEANKAITDLSGYMLHNKPLYVAIAQRKEVRRVQLQAQWHARIAQPIPGMPGPGGAVVPSGYPAMYYAPPGVVTQAPQRQGIMYPSMGLRAGWRPAPAFPSRPGFQPMTLVIPNNPGQQRQPRARVNGPMLSQQGHPMTYVPPLQQKPLPPNFIQRCSWKSA